MGMFDIDDKIDKWLNERWSLFTGSENVKLFSPGKYAGLFGEGAYTYIEQKALEEVTVLTQRPELENVESLRHGKAFEEMAWERYVKETKNYSMTYLGTGNPLFLYDESVKNSAGKIQAGVSPDAINLTSSATVDAGAEFKCPSNPLNHFRRLSWKTQFDIKEFYKLVYVQIQCDLKATGAYLWQFASFDERITTYSKQIKIIDVKPDRNMFMELDVRLNKAVELKYQIIDEKMNS